MRGETLARSARAVVFLAVGASVSFAQELPLADGAYITNTHCDMAERGELDMVSFLVEKQGRSITMYESGCLVASVQQVRANRFWVETDCQEFGEIFQEAFFLDVISSEEIRVNGEDLMICSKGFLAGLQMEPFHDDLVESWHLANANCRGGSGDDQATWEACRERDDLAAQLDEAGWCFGKEEQPASAFDWHQCEPDSIR